MSELYQLPDGWEWKKLSDVCDSMQGIQLPKVEQICELREGYVRYLYISDFTTDKNIIYVVDQYKNKIVNEHEYVIVNTGATAGKIFHGKRGVLSNNLFKVSNFKNINDRYFYFYYLVLYQNIISNELKQSTQPHLGHKAFNGYDIPLPPIPEQKRIVQKLDALFERVDKAIALLQKNIAAANNFMNSVLNDVFSDLDNKFPSKRFDTYTKLSRGHNPPKSDFIYEPRDGYIRFIQIRDGSSDDNAVYVPITPKLHIVTVDDLLLVAYRQVGKVFRGINGAFNVALCKIENVDNTNLSTDYLYYIIQSKYVKEELLSRSERALIPSMSVEHLKSILIPLPDVEVQRKVVDCLDNISAQIEQVKSAQQQKMQSLLDLKSSILDQAFHGKL